MRRGRGCLRCAGAVAGQRVRPRRGRHKGPARNWPMAARVRRSRSEEARMRVSGRRRLTRPGCAGVARHSCSARRKRKQAALEGVRESRRCRRDRGCLPGRIRTAGPPWGRWVRLIGCHRRRIRRGRRRRMTMNGPSALEEQAWMARATSCLPVPASPRISAMRQIGRYALDL